MNVNFPHQNSLDSGLKFPISKIRINGTHRRRKGKDAKKINGNRVGIRFLDTANKRI